MSKKRENKKKIFDDAPELPPIIPLARRRSKLRKQVKIQDQDLLVCHLTEMRKHRDEFLELYKSQKKHVKKQFAKDAFELKKKPEAFIGIGDISQVHCEIRRKGSNIPLSDKITEWLDSKGIPYDKHVKIPARWVINEEAESTLEIVAKILASHPNKKVRALIKRQPKETIHAVSDATIDVMAQKCTQSEIDEFLEELAFYAPCSRPMLYNQRIYDGNGRVAEKAHEIARDYLAEFTIAAKKARKYG